MATSPNPYRLTLRGTYILPSGAGLLQTLGWILLTAACLNFGLGVMLVFCLLLAAIALVCMVETVRNLAGLEVELQPPGPSVAGQPAVFTAMLRPLDGRARPGLLLALSGPTQAGGMRGRLGLHLMRQVVACDVAAGGSLVELPLTSENRGRLQAERLLVASTWPLGLFRAWRAWTPDVHALVHPEPMAAASARQRREGAALHDDVRLDAPTRAGAGDAHGEFAGHRDRQPGDPLRRVDWRASLRAGRVLVALREAAAQGMPLWLRWEDHAPAAAEVRLARLTAEVQAAFHHGRRFGLELPGARLPLGSGRTQRDQALAMLAVAPDEDTPAQPPAVRVAAPPAAPEPPALAPALLLQWTAIVLVSALPLAFQVHASAWAPWGLLMLARLWLLRVHARPPGTLWLTLGALASAAWIHGQYHALLGREPGMALLLLMAGFKLLEARRPRDLHTLAMLSLFLLLSAHFRTQAPWLGAWDLLACLLVLDGLLAGQQAAPWRQRWRTVLRMTVLALPVGALLFVLMPRPEHPFWGFSSADEGTSGSLSDRMSPGSISHLRLSEQVAFRVHFDGSWPGQAELYWRGPVLEDFDGRTWSVSATPHRRFAATRRGATRYAYTYQAENRNSPWVFALEWPDTAASGLQLDAQAVTRIEDVGARARAYHLLAWPKANLGADLDPASLVADLRVPEGNPLTRALAEPWRALPPAERLRAARQALLDAHLQYSLDVPTVGNDPVDELMFGSRTGYCEHFASAFAFMLRAAGLPTRVVTGYQGGERNPLGDYLIVRQSDAHAWVETWIEGQGWLRIDPTALTVPALLLGGAPAAAPLPAPNWLPGFARATLPAWHRLQLLRDLAAMRWQQNVAGLDAARQRALLEQLGLGGIGRPSLVAACALLVSAALGVQLLLAMRERSGGAGQARTLKAATAGPSARESRQRRRWQRQWQRGEALLRLAGLPRAASEGPWAYRERMHAERPELREALDAWAQPCLLGIYAAQEGSIRLPGGARRARQLLALALALLQPLAHGEARTAKR